MLNVILAVFTALVLVLLGVSVIGSYRWSSGTVALRARLDSARAPVVPKSVDFSELEGLPAPVQRFFRTALKEGQPMIAGVRVQHKGTFNMGELADQWKDFTSDQEVITRGPGFDWDGLITMMPGLPVYVHDAYIAGEGLLHASLFGVFTLTNVRNTTDMAEGELMRFLAEASWYPTALLPSQSVHWKAVDDRSAYATLTDGKVSVTLLITFNGDNLIETVRTETRGRLVGGKMVPTPWQGRFWNYAERAGMKIPLNGEVAWLLPTGEKPYWRGQMSEIAYRFAE